MKRFLLAAAVAAASLAITPSVHAQLPREAGFGEIFSTDFMPRDMSLFVDFLELEDWQRPVLEALLVDYQSEYRAGEQGLRDKLTAMKDQIAGAGENGGLTVLMKPIEDWKVEKEAMKQRFLDDVRGQLSDAQLERWPRLERALRREKQLPQGRLSGEKTDLIIVMRQIDVPLDNRLEAKDAIAAYESALDLALMERMKQQESSQPRIRKAITDNDSGSGLAELERIVAARIAVRNVTDAHIDALATAFGAEWGPKFRERAMRDAYPLACRTPPLDPFFENVLAIEDLSAEQLTQINDIRSRFNDAMNTLQGVFVAKVRQVEPERETERARLAADAARNVQASKGEQEPYRDLITERDRLIEDARTRVIALLNEDQKAKIPGIDKYLNKEEDRAKPGSEDAKKRQMLRSDDGVLRNADGDGLGTQSPDPRVKGGGNGTDTPR
ncbi:MAG: hypothetical protein FJ252_04140 [Phycisphaerae bacterium]|nr:hypothetical protein [Phycisphaerae bacterium]